MKSTFGPRGSGRKKRVQILADDGYQPPRRYWNEYDDGDSDSNSEEGYILYVDPNEPLFPVLETASNAFGAVYHSFSEGKSKLIDWLLKPKQKNSQGAAERTPLLFGQQAIESDLESSGSLDNDLTIRRPRTSRNRPATPPGSKRSNVLLRLPEQQLNPQQEAFENKLFQFYNGLIGFSYIMLVMAGTLLSINRQKGQVEIDARVVAGIVTAEMCAVLAVIMIFMRKQRLHIFHWGLFIVAVAGVTTIGMALLCLILVDVRKEVLKDGAE
ncbi:uncharacterized protein A1O9_07416 [Exophiala aquamarina CBS 119918]|uniref:Uncharacterized protein n=1 Tax=Exophiala aquamarina CBS 119918 TaxID=1182545 RepID=A0A072PBK0_9EURO|nr:uncharacterized protein A1O9_07416 [Exophiala aquamarina CBS 119918]KEF57226.1 hypothetical protein A1O9_07416 [Exophiala aquamarina CBS 119918]